MVAPTIGARDQHTDTCWLDVDIIGTFDKRAINML